MRTTKDKPAGSTLPAAVAAICLLVSVTTARAITDLTRPTAHLGDIVAFSASSAETAEGGVRLIVHRQDQFGCVLDTNVLRRSGGSLIVEGQLGTGKSLRVHWAGARTTDDAGSCGAQADLIIETEDLDLLALAAGGYGAGRKQTPFFAVGFGNRSHSGWMPTLIPIDVEHYSRHGDAGRS